MTNPYSPPPTVPPRHTTAWYHTRPADWERTASIAWVFTCLLLLLVSDENSSAASPTSQPWLDGLRTVLPGPETVGWFVFYLEIPLLSLIPAAFFGAMHWGLMRVSSRLLYRLPLRCVCLLLALLGCSLFASLFMGT